MKAVFSFVAGAVLFAAQTFTSETLPSTDPFMAEYAGFWTATSGAKGRMTAQIRPLGNGEYEGFVVLNRAKNPVTAFQLKKSRVENGKLQFAGSSGNSTGGDLLGQNELTAELQNGAITGKFSGDVGEGTFEAGKSARKSPTLGAKPQNTSVVLLTESGGKDWENMSWEVKDGVARVGKGNVWAKEKLANYQLHLEFRTPYMPSEVGQKRGNSGVYLQGKYEVQVLDSFGLYPLQDNDCGGIYRVKAPNWNASLPPGEWQTYDITFLEGKGNRPPRITVELNGVKVIDRAEVAANLVADGTGGGEPKAGFLMLQDHGNPVEFRNIWAQPIFSSQKLQ